jgi:hypothetical protein
MEENNMFINVTAKAVEMAKSEHRAAHTYGTIEYKNLQDFAPAAYAEIIIGGTNAPPYMT